MHRWLKEILGNLKTLEASTIFVFVLFLFDCFNNGINLPFFHLLYFTISKKYNFKFLDMLSEILNSILTILTNFS